jgi:predicted NBD/HSP70 family sugar kinase
MTKRILRRRILVLDVGGAHVKCMASGRSGAAKFKSGPGFKPGDMVKNVLRITRGWRFDAISIGYPGVVIHNRIVREPYNLGTGWTGFDFEAAFGRPVKIINDAAMQALGGYAGGKMLFLGLGTGLGSALVVDGAVAAMELGHLQYRTKRTYEDWVGEHARKRAGNIKWRKRVETVVAGLRDALLPDYIVLGGGNVAHLKPWIAHTRRGNNACAFAGGFRLWEHDRHAALTGRGPGARAALRGAGARKRAAT